jgi:hypothetical protein
MLMLQSRMTPSSCELEVLRIIGQTGGTIVPVAGAVAHDGAGGNGAEVRARVRPFSLARFR